MTPDKATYLDDFSKRFKSLEHGGSRSLILHKLIDRVAPLYATYWLSPFSLPYVAKLREATTIATALTEREVTRKEQLDAREHALDAEAAALSSCNSKNADSVVCVAMAVRLLFDTYLSDDPETIQTLQHNCLLHCLSVILSASDDWHTIHRTLRYDMFRADDGQEDFDDKPESVAALLSVWPFGPPNDWPQESPAFVIESLYGARKSLGSAVRSFLG